MWGVIPDLKNKGSILFEKEICTIKILNPDEETESDPETELEAKQETCRNCFT